MNILISGGAGFIGSRLSSTLFNHGHCVTVLDNLSPQIHGQNPENSELFRSIANIATFIQGDVCKREDWLAALNGQEVVVHLAAETGTGQSMYQIERYVDVNVKGTAILLDILANERHSIKKMVVASSRAIYGEGKYMGCTKVVYPEARQESDLLLGRFECRCPETGEDLRPLPTDEESKINPTSIYGITKFNQEQMMLAMGKALGISSLAFRYQNVYGPGQSLSNPYTGILSIFSTQLLQGMDINIFEDGKESRDFVYIDDVVDATVRGIETESVDYGAFNVGSGVQTDVYSVALTLRDFYRATGDINVTGNFRLGDIRHNFACLDKIRNAFGFEPTVNFELGISKFCKWVLTQKIQDSGYQQSIQEMKNKGLLK